MHALSRFDRLCVSVAYRVKDVTCGIRKSALSSGERGESWPWLEASRGVPVTINSICRPLTVRKPFVCWKEEHESESYKPTSPSAISVRDQLATAYSRRLYLCIEDAGVLSAKHFCEDAEWRLRIYRCQPYCRRRRHKQSCIPHLLFSFSSFICLQEY